MDFYASSLGSLLGTLVTDTPGLTHAALASVEGVPVAVSPGLPPDRAEQLAGIGAGLLSIANGAGQVMGFGPPHQVIVEMAMGVVVATPVAPRVGLTLLAVSTADRERIGYEVGQFVDRVRPLLETML
ncbi:roadblock/LC7 domain-containing protein [Longispora albida]|uniref:roadblock/LC7 domain-containing protein n=1 Tax=Longispora albida TaxID=203523 RepID=UPI000360DCD0|nr:roadblock/LC7 domain-containing protein [Longispora albida]